MIDVTRSVEDHLACAIYAGFTGKDGLDLPWDLWENGLQEWERRRYRRCANRVQTIMRDILPPVAWRFL